MHGALGSSNETLDGWSRSPMSLQERGNVRRQSAPVAFHGKLQQVRESKEFVGVGA